MEVKDILDLYNPFNKSHFISVVFDINGIRKTVHFSIDDGLLLKVDDDHTFEIKEEINNA